MFHHRVTNLGSSFKKIVVKQYWTKTAESILSFPVSSIRGISDRDAAKLDDAINVKTVKDLAENRYVNGAKAVLAATNQPNFDPGPPLEWVKVFAAAPDYTSKWPDKFRWEFGPIFYRGRLDGTARILIIGQDPSTDEALARRAFVGRSGQRLQGLLRKLGITYSYVMVNAFLYSIYGQFDHEMEAISTDPLVMDYRNTLCDKILSENPVEAVLTIGAGARHAVQHWPHPSNLHVSNLVHPSAKTELVLNNWNQELSILLQIVEPEIGVTPNSTPYTLEWKPSDYMDIPRRDLPFGVPSWFGTQGTKSHRDGPKRIIWET